MFNNFRFGKRRSSTDNAGETEQPQSDHQSPPTLPPIDTRTQNLNQLSSSAAHSPSNSSPSPKSASPQQQTGSSSAPASSPSPNQPAPTSRGATASPSPILTHEHPTNVARPSSASPPPPSAYPTNWRSEEAPSRLSYKSFAGTSEGYPSWLPRRPPPPAPASSVGTGANTPMLLGGSTAEFGEHGLGEFEREYREYLRQVGSQGSFVEPDNVDQPTHRDKPDHPDPDPDTTADMAELSAEIDYLRGGLAALRREAGSPESPEDPIPPAQLGGRRATPRSVRIVNLQTDVVAKGLGVGPPPSRPVSGGSVVREPTDQTRVASGASTNLSAPLGFAHSDWYSRKKSQHGKRTSSGSTGVPHIRVPRTRASLPPNAFFSAVSTADPRQGEQKTRPRFNIRGLQLELLRSPSIWMRVYYRLWPILVLGHLPVQAFFDFNAVYMILQVSRYPLPSSGPNSKKNWTLCAVAYIACWLISVLMIFVLYELVYSFTRRWRIRRPLIFPLYLSAPGYSFAAMTSFNVFCFLQHLRWTAFVPIGPELDGGVHEGSSTSSSASSSPRSSAEICQEGAGDSEKVNASGIIEEIRTPPMTHHRQRTRDRHMRTDSEASSEAGEADSLAHHRSNSHHENANRASKKQNRKGLVKTLEKKLRRTSRTWKKRTQKVTWRDGLAETFNLYSQNLPNIVTLLPRAAIALGLLLSFSGSASGPIGLAINRDTTFFRKDNGLLSDYAIGVLWLNVAWTAWRSLVLLSSWIGLWVLSGHGCAGICGPRDKWEEQRLNRLSGTFSHHRRSSVHSTSSSLATEDDGVLPWEWRECTKARVVDAWQFCLVGVGSGRYQWGVEKPTAAYEKHRMDQVPEEDDDGGLSDEGLQRVLAAVGFQSQATPAKRGALRQDLFDSPTKKSSRDLETGMLGELTPIKALEAPGPGLPLLKLPYPFAQPGSGQVSSKDRIPFPKDKENASTSSKSSKAKSRSSGKRTSKSTTTSSGSSSSGSGESSIAEEDGHDDQAHGEGAEESSSHEYSEEPSTSSDQVSSRASGGGRASNSMSSLGHPIINTFGRITPGDRRSVSQYSTSPPPIGRVQAAHSNSSGSPLSWKSSDEGRQINLINVPPSLVGAPGTQGHGMTRFPFLANPPPHFQHQYHGRGRGGSFTSSTGHSRGLSQMSGFSGISGISGISVGSGYAASGSAGHNMSDADYNISGMSDESFGQILEEIKRERNTSAGSGNSAGSRNSGGSGVFPMPPRHPHLEGGKRRSRAASSSSASPRSTSSPSGDNKAADTSNDSQPPPRLGNIIFPRLSGRGPELRGGPNVLDSSAEIELGLGALSHPAALAAMRGRMTRMGEDDGRSLQLSLRGEGDETERRDIRDISFDEEEEFAELDGERGDVVGLLGTGSGHNSTGPSPRSSMIGLEQQQEASVPRSRTRSRRSSTARSRSSPRQSVTGRPLSLSIVTPERSRQSSFNRQGYSVAPESPSSPMSIRERTESAASAARVRASSFGVRLRERAHSLMQSIAMSPPSTGSTPAKSAGGMSMANLPQGTPSGHRRLASSDAESMLDGYVTGSVVSRRPQVMRSDTVLSAAAGTEHQPAPIGRSVSGQSGSSVGTGESSGSGGSSNSAGLRHPQLIEEEAYYSSSGHSHSRSDSESHASAADANYTFGRPVPFLQVPQEPMPRLVSPESSPIEPSPPSPASDVHDDDMEGAQSPALTARARAGSATPSLLSSSGLLTPVPRAQSASFEVQQSEESPPDVFLHPPSAATSAWTRDLSSTPSSDYLSINTHGSSSVMMLSSAAESFVTAAPSMAESGTTMTSGNSAGSADTAGTVSGSWEEQHGGLVGMLLGGAATRPSTMLQHRGRRGSGMVERADDYTGAGGGIGDGRIA